ncbi:acyl-CoA carboxylase subunit epsilon [Geodermatophilus sp. SYSU D00742]
MSGGALDPADIAVVRGRPTPEEVAALVAVLVTVARRPGPGAAVRRAPRPRDRGWQAPVAWVTGMRPWDRPRR